MMQATTKRCEESRESGAEMKGVVLILICYFYGILLFLFFGTVTKLGQFVLSKVKEQVKKIQFWDVKEECSKYDINHNVRHTTKHVFIGQR